MSETFNNAKPHVVKEETESVELTSAAGDSHTAMVLATDVVRSSKDERSQRIEKVGSIGDAVETTPSVDSIADVDATAGIGTPSNSRGMRRHKLTLTAIALLALGALALNVLDLKPLISEEGTVDRNFKFRPTEKMSELSSNASYTGGSLKEGLIPISEFTLEGQTIGFADAKGHVVIPAAYARAKNFSNGLAAVKMPGEDGKWGFINHAGHLVIPAIYTKINSFHDGIALVTADGLEQIIDQSGKNCLPPGAHSVKQASGGFFLVSNSEKKLWGVWKGRDFVIPPKYEDVSQVISNSDSYSPYSSDVNGFADSVVETSDKSSPIYFKLRKNGLYALADSAGKICFPNRFEEIESVRKNHAAIMQDGKYGFVDLTGNLVITPQYDEVSAYDDLIAVIEGGKVRLIDAAGKAVDKIAIDNVSVDPYTQSLLQDGMVIFRRKDLYGYLDNHGREVIAPKYKRAYSFQNGVARVWDGSRQFFIDKHGVNLTAKGYIFAAPFIDGKAKVTIAGSLYSAIEEFPKTLLKTKPEAPAELKGNNQNSNFESAEF